MAPEDLGDQLTLLSQAIEFDGSSFTWFGDREPALPARLARGLPRELLCDHLADTLRRRMYSDFYCRGRATPVASRASRGRSAAPAGYQAELSAANGGHGSWDAGWVVQDVEHGRMRVEQRGFTITVAEGDCRWTLGLRPQAGMAAYVRMPKELLALSPGYYLALSDAPFRVDDEPVIVRLYWNLAPSGAARLLKEVTGAFNQAGVPFRLKVVNLPSGYDRCDSGVLYLQKRDYASARPLLEELYPRVNGWLRRDTTVFTKCLAPGIGMAESPSPVASFGAHRCGIVADALIRAREEGRKSVTERLQIIKDTFREHGLSFEATHLNPGSRDEYELSLRANARPGGESAIPGSIHSRAGKKSDRQQFLDAAIAIGELLTDRAAWHQGRCNWMGLALSPDSAAADSSILTYRSLGPDVYSGTSGVALFLAELHGAAGGETIRRTAIGAARQALSLASRPSPAGQPALFTGTLGEISTAARIGWALGVDELLDGAAGLLQTSLRRIEENGQSDLISGHAGAILGLLMLERISPTLVTPGLATRLGDALLNRAKQKLASCSWQSPSFPNQRPLTGLSHGAAGIGWALLELSQSTGVPRFREAAEMAFNYERAWFDEKAGNWADLRGLSARKRRPEHPLSFQVSWCHGAPGIALSRIRAHEAWGGERWKREALAALNTTMAWTRRMLDADGTNFGLCHGLAGNAHILIKGSEALGSAFPAGGELSREVAAAGISRYASRGHQWPFGALGVRSPGLMCGLSGVGHFYLSLWDPAIPSILSGGLHKKGERNASQTTSAHGDRGFSPP
jgi:hypothetical protein